MHLSFCSLPTMVGRAEVMPGWPHILYQEKNFSLEFERKERSLHLQLAFFCLSLITRGCSGPRPSVQANTLPEAIRELSAEATSQAQLICFRALTTNTQASKPQASLSPSLHSWAGGEGGAERGRGYWNAILNCKSVLAKTLRLIKHDLWATGLRLKKQKGFPPLSSSKTVYWFESPYGAPTKQKGEQREL